MVALAGDDRAILSSIFDGVDDDPNLKPEEIEKERYGQLNVEDVSKFKHGFTIAKFNNIRTDGGNTTDPKFNDSDFFLMRAAEAWLTYAEAETRLGQ